MKTMILAVPLLLCGTVFADEPASRIVEEAQLPKIYKAIGTTAPEYPAAYAATEDDVCISIGYTIKEDGTTGDHELLSVWTSDRKIAETDKNYLPAFADAAARTVSQWHYTPLKAGASAGPVLTAATLEFDGKDGSRRLGDRCRVVSLARYHRAKGDLDETGVSELVRRSEQSDRGRSDSEAYGNQWTRQRAPASQTTP